MQTLKCASVFLCLVGVVTYGHAQVAASASFAMPTITASVPVESSSLPDSPGALLAATAEGAAPSDPVAKKTARVIRADQTALPLSSGDKFKMAFATQLTLRGAGGIFLSAGLGQLRGGTPHYGSDSGAFGERLGAAELKRTSDQFFSYGLYATLFHDDPRYYVMGRKEKFSKRAIYAATRVLITRKDDGSSGVNYARLAGIASSAALTNAYYPEQDRGARRTLSSIGSQIGTSAGGNEIHEFLSDILHAIFHRHQDDTKP